MPLVSLRRTAEEQWKQSYEQLQAAGRLITGAENAERRRISRDIEDNLGQLLNGMRFDMTWLHKRCAALPNTAGLNPATALKSSRCFRPMLSECPPPME